MTDLDRILAEQRWCRDQILARGDDPEGAWLGMSDWVTEEVIVITENEKEKPDDILF